MMVWWPDATRQTAIACGDPEPPGLIFEKVPSQSTRFTLRSKRFNCPVFRTGQMIL
jgi:hypothetical protein